MKLLKWLSDPDGFGIIVGYTLACVLVLVVDSFVVAHVAISVALAALLLAWLAYRRAAR